MSGKYMNIKRMLVSVLACMVISMNLIGCAAVSSSELYDLLQSGAEIELMVAMPEKEIESKVGVYETLPLDALQSYKTSFRPNFDKLFNITIVTDGGINSKSGCIYINEEGERDGNRTFFDSLRNRAFMEKYANDTGVILGLGNIAGKIYTDVDETTGDGVLAAYNAYYNLFPEENEGSLFNASKTLTREEFYAFVYKMSEKYGEVQESESLKKALGISTLGQSARYAGVVEKDAWLNSKNGGLRIGNFRKEISRVEAIYLLMNKYFGQELKEMDGKGISLADAKDGGDMTKEKPDVLVLVDKDTKEENLADGWQLGVLSIMLKSDNNKVQSDLYKALGLAHELGIIGAEMDWNEALTKREAIELVIGVAKAVNKRDGYATVDEYGKMKGNEMEEAAIAAIIDAGLGNDSEAEIRSNAALGLLPPSYEERMKKDRLTESSKELMRRTVLVDLADFEEYYEIYKKDGLIEYVGNGEGSTSTISGGGDKPSVNNGGSNGSGVGNVGNGSGNGSGSGNSGGNANNGNGNNGNVNSGNTGNGSSGSGVVGLGNDVGETDEDLASFGVKIGEDGLVDGFEPGKASGIQLG